jgi:hypothetical protein
MTINILPDEVILYIFSFHRQLDNKYDTVDTPLSVTWKWRYLIFTSPHYLGLRLAITNNPLMKPGNFFWDSWPALPISIWSEVDWQLDRHLGKVAAAFEHSDRVHEMRPYISSLVLAKLTALEALFPALERLHLISPHGYMTLLPNAFLGRSTAGARLRHIHLENVF